jgi:hypothetical protein
MSLLNNELLCDYYCLDNQFSPVSAATIWDAAKATTGGYIISQASLIKKLIMENRVKKYQSQCQP